MLGSHWAEGHCVPWNFDSILWALRWQEWALCRGRDDQNGCRKTASVTLWRWARPEQGPNPAAICLQVNCSCVVGPEQEERDMS